MKLSVITLHTVNSYGSVLQTYATQQVLEGMGHRVEFVDYWRKDNRGRHAVDKALASDSMQRYRRLWDRPVLRQAVRLPLWLMLRRKHAPMWRFVRRRIHLTPRRYDSPQQLLDAPPQADAYLTGSDQVWNSVWNQGLEKPYFLDYAPAGKPRIAFSASIGREALSREEVAEMRPLLRRYNFLSLREQSGVELVRAMGLPARQVADPTLLLGPEDWRRIALATGEKAPYLLLYQLNHNPRMDAYARALAAREGLRLIRLSYGYGGRRGAGEKLLVCPPVERLLGYFLEADCVLTDSFHATAFALNFGRPFVAVPPARFATRIESILAWTGTQRHLLRDFDDFSIAGLPLDTAGIAARLETARQATRDFLREALV